MKWRRDPQNGRNLYQLSSRRLACKMCKGVKKVNIKKISRGKWSSLFLLPFISNPPVSYPQLCSRPPREGSPSSLHPQGIMQISYSLFYTLSLLPQPPTPRGTLHSVETTGHVVQDIREEFYTPPWPLHQQILLQVPGLFERLSWLP